MSRKNCQVIFLKQDIKFSQKVTLRIFQTFKDKMTLTYKYIPVFSSPCTAHYNTAKLFSNYFQWYFIALSFLFLQ